MTFEFRRNLVGFLALLFLGSLVAVSIIDSTRHPSEGVVTKPVIPADSKSCVECHTKVGPEQVHQWNISMHAAKGIGCMACHGVKSGEGFMHHGSRVTMIVSPKVCASCHKTETAEMAKTAHGKAIPGHEIKLVDGKPDPHSWPAPKIGRIYPDGTAGTCTTCHERHNFSAMSARDPKVCISCHLSDGSAEAWMRSPHGAAYSSAHANAADKQKFPACTTCHMAATISGAATHDLSSRLTWEVGAKGAVTQRSDADARRDAMFDACLQCHGNTFVEDAFAKIDGTFKSHPGKSFPFPHEYLSLPGSWPHVSPEERALLPGAVSSTAK